MRFTYHLFITGIFIFFPIAAVYGYFSHMEPVGTAAIAMLGGLSGMIGVYLWQMNRRLDRLPEDSNEAEVEEGAGPQGVYAPWSWWPLVLASAAALAMTGMAVGWWFFAFGAALGLFGLVGWVMEYSRKNHAH